MIINNNILNKLNKFNFSTIKRFSTSINNSNITSIKNEQQQLEEKQNTPTTTNYCHNYFSDVQNYKSYDDNNNLIKHREGDVTLKGHLNESHQYHGIFGPIKKQMAYLTKIVENGCITFRNDRIFYKNQLLPKALALQEPLLKRIFPTFQYHNHDSYYHLSFHERKDIVSYRNDRLTFIPLSIFLSIPFSTFLLPFYIKFLPGLLPRGFSERNQVLSRHEKMMNLRHHCALKLFKKYELEEKIEKLFPNGLKSIGDINVLKIVDLDDDFSLDFFNIKRKRLRTICRSLGESTILNSNSTLKDKILNFGEYIDAENDQIIKEINSLTFEDFQDLLYERSLSFNGLNYYEMKEKFIKYSKLLKTLKTQEIAKDEQIQSKEQNKVLGFYKRFILLNSIILKYKL